jgi:hypothetical protein
MTDMNMADALQAEQRTVSPSGQVAIEGRNWAAPELLDHANRRVHLLLDVVGGELVVRVYSLAGQFVCNAQLVKTEPWSPVAYRKQIVIMKGALQ